VSPPPAPFSLTKRSLSSLFQSSPGYLALPALRRRLKRATAALAGLAAARTLWAAWAPLAAGAPLPAPAVLAVAVGAASVGAAHAAGSGFGRPQRERRGLLGLLPSLAVLLALLVTGLTGFEHTALPRHARRPAQAAEALVARVGLARPAAARLARAVDAAADGGLVLASLCVAATAGAYNKLAGGGRGKRD